MLNPHIFRAYDVRGRVGSDINPEVFRLVGRAYGSLIHGNGGRTIAVGQDNRESSAALKSGFVDGVRAAGVDVVDVGTVTTPILYFATAHWKLDGGANITGSHNPVEYNGVKMVHPGAAPLTEQEIQGLRQTIERATFASGAGQVTSRSPRDDYFDTIAQLVHLPRPLSVVADAGNGIAGVYGPALLRRLGCDVIELHCESDGRFPNHLPDPEDPDNVVDLQEKVFEARADLGLAWDGDADRVGVIDERGRRHAADPISTLFDSVPHLHATPELKAPCPDGEKFRVIDQLARALKTRFQTIDIDGARVLFPGGGWGLVRASNTNPYLTLRFEAQTEREIVDMKRVIYDALRRYPFVTLPSS